MTLTAVDQLFPSADFFQNELSQFLLGTTLSECQTVWIQIRADILSVLIWVQTVFKGYQQTSEVAVSKERVNCSKCHIFDIFMAVSFLVEAMIYFQMF